MDKEMLATKNIVPVVIHYSFDCETPVILCESDEEARKIIRMDYEEEIRIATEENGHIFGEDLEGTHDADWQYAKITLDLGDGDDPDIIEWSIGTIKAV